MIFLKPNQTAAIQQSSSAAVTGDTLVTMRI